MLGPLFRYELLRTGRRRRYFLLRTAYVSVFFLMLWGAYQGAGWVSDYSSPQHAAWVAQSLFQYLSLGAVTVAIFITAAVTTGTIAEERDRRTIEYLFVSDLTNVEIVFGKLGVRVLHVLLLLASALPMVALSMLFGGVRGQSLVELSIVLTSTVLTTAAICLAVSVWSGKARVSITASCVLLAGLLFVPPIASTLLFYTPHLYAPHLGWLSPWIEPFRQANPYVYLSEMFSGWIYSAPGTLWSNVVELVRNQLIVAVPLFAVSVWRVRRVHFAMTARPVVAESTGRFRRRRPQIGRYPMLWKEQYTDRSRFRRGPVGLALNALVVLASLAFIGWVFWKTLDQTYDVYTVQDFAVVACSALSCLILICLCGRTASSITSERERSTWDMLRTSELTPTEILSAKALGSAYAVRMLFALVVVIWGLAIFIVPESWGRGSAQILVTGLLVPFFTGSGLAISLLARSTTVAISFALALCAFLGGGYIFCCVPLFYGSDEVVLMAWFPFLLSYFTWAEWAGEPGEEMAIVCMGVVFYLMAGIVFWTLSLYLFNSADAGFLSSRNPFDRRKDRAPTTAAPPERPVDGPMS